MKTLRVKASSAPGTVLLVRQRTDNKGLQAMLLHHREHRWWSVGPAALQRDADPLLRASWASSGVPNVPVPPLDQQHNAAAVCHHEWQGRHSYHWRDHRSTGRAGACHGTLRIWAEQEPALLGKQPAPTHSGEVSFVHLTFPHLHWLCDMLILSTGLFRAPIKSCTWE